MKSPETAFAIAKAAVENASCPVTAKIRAGWDDESINAVYIAQGLEAAGIKAVAVGIPLVGLNLDAVWQNMVVPISDMEIAEGNTLAEQILADDERAKLLSRIETLERQMRATPQKHKQRELYAEIKKLKGLIV